MNTRPTLREAPPLPPPYSRFQHESGKAMYSEDQMRAYGQQCALAALDAAPPEPVGRRTGFAAKRDHYAMPVLFNPYTGEPRDVRDVGSDPQGILIRPPGAQLIAAPPAAAPVQPLSDEQIAAICGTEGQPHMHQYAVRFIRAAEAAHGIAPVAADTPESKS